jgi:hypothetical protein
MTLNWSQLLMILVFYPMIYSMLDCLSFSLYIVCDFKIIFIYTFLWCFVAKGCSLRCLNQDFRGTLLLHIVVLMFIFHYCRYLNAYSLFFCLVYSSSLNGCWVVVFFVWSDLLVTYTLLMINLPTLNWWSISCVDDEFTYN